MPRYDFIFLIYSAQCSLSLTIWLNLSLLISIISFWKFSAINMSNIWHSKNIWHINILLLAFLLWYAIPSWNCYTILGCPVLVFIFFLLDASVWEVSIFLFNFIDSSLLCQVYSWAHQTHFSFVLQWVWYLAFSFDLFSWSFHLSANIAHLFFSFTWVFFFIRDLNKLIIVI